MFVFFFNDPATTEIYTLSLHDALPIFNNHYREDFINRGMRFSGLSPDDRLVEVVEITDHPWFLATQYHPEFKSKPDQAAPLFRDFIAAAVKYKRNKR